MCENRKKGDLAEMRAMMIFSEFGFLVSKPITHSSHYDIVVDINKKVYRIEVKSTTKKTKSGYYYIDTRSYSKKLYKRLDPNENDFVFVIDGNGKCYMIESCVFESKSYLTLNYDCEKYVVCGVEDVHRLTFKNN